MGRLHIDVASNIRVASPYLFGRPVTVQTGGTTVDLIDDRGLFSRWTHWYVDWEPVHPIALVNPLGALTTVRSSDLRSLAAEPGVDIAWFARVKIGRRTEVYRDYEVEERGFWLDDPAPEAIAKAGT
ncbi:hypothetical protein [Phenylobacterium sp.]|uniref:hypothetical protein n=1 Tax=Phenylobacterium sp. TaxID=1871053 RepID=UPI0025E5721E|nr:hypothetical protein [Phenylobacterium sp.]